MVTTWLHGFTAHPPRRSSGSASGRATGDSSFSVATTGASGGWSVQLGTRELTAQMASELTRASSVDSDFTSMASQEGEGDRGVQVGQRGSSPRPGSQGYWEVHEAGESGGAAGGGGGSSGGVHGRSKLGMSPRGSPRSSLNLARKPEQEQEQAEGQQQEEQASNGALQQEQQQPLVGPEEGGQAGAPRGGVASVVLVGQGSKVPLLQDEGQEEGQASSSCP